MAALEVNLIKAVEENDINEVICLLEKGANINVFTSGKTPLGIAAHQGNVSMLELLLNCRHFKAKADSTTKKKYNQNDSTRSTCEHSAVKKRKSIEGNNGYYEVIYDDKSDDDDSDINKNLDEAETPEGMDCLEWDLELEDSDINDDVYEDAWSDQYRWYAKILANSCYVPSDLPYWCDVNLQDSFGRCAIHYASEQGHVNAVKVLINAGCKADLGDVDSLTPLHLASNSGHLSVVETLLSSGCHVNAKTTDKLSPLHYAAARGFRDVVGALLDAGANIDSLDAGERTPLILAVSRNIYDVVKALVDRGARVNIEDVKGSELAPKNSYTLCTYEREHRTYCAASNIKPEKTFGYTALCEAVWHKSVPIVKLLIEAGAKVVPTHYLVHYAVLHRQPEMVSALLEAGALVNMRDAFGDTPLITAAISSQPEMVKLLLSHGAAVDQIGGGYEKTALICAIADSDRPSFNVIMTLIEAGGDVRRLTTGVINLSSLLVTGKTRAALVLIALGSDLAPTIMSIARSIQSVPIARAMVYAGYKLKRNEPKIRPPKEWPVDTTTVDGFLQHTKYNPMGLAELCRIVVRKQAVGSLPLWLHNLQVPPIITRFLAMEEVMHSEIEQEPTCSNINGNTMCRNRMYLFNGRYGQLLDERNLNMEE